MIALAGTKRRTYLEQTAAAIDVRLDATDLAELDRIAPRGVAAGERYPEAGMKSLNA